LPKDEDRSRNALKAPCTSSWRDPGRQIRATGDRSMSQPAQLLRFSCGDAVAGGRHGAAEGTRDMTTGAGAEEAPRYAVERQVLYRKPLHERNYAIVWAIWDRRARRFLGVLFRSRPDAERHERALRSNVDGGGD
jgi:hypothetical protein